MDKASMKKEHLAKQTAKEHMAKGTQG